MPKRFFDLTQRIAGDLPSSQRLRLHVDCNSDESILIYTHYRDTLLGLLKDDPLFPPDERAKIMRSVGEAVQELHAEDWVHAGICIYDQMQQVLTLLPDIKPDNILVDWTSDSEGTKVVTDVALGDFDIACQLKPGESRLTRQAVGNAMWRSPEAQTGLSSRASDLYSLGLVVSPVYPQGRSLSDSSS